METKSLLIGIISFMAGGLLVSIAAVTFDKPEPETKTDSSSMTYMNHSLKDKTGDEFDQEFIEQMIIHHEGAVSMAKLAETNAKHDEIKTLSKAIITAQEDEMSQMLKWQEEWNYSKSEELNKFHNDNH